MADNMVLFKLDRSDPAPLYRQVINELQKLIEDGSLSPGMHLPPTRKLARLLGVDRSTTFRAYQELLALGFVDSRPGSFTTVRARPRITTAERPAEPPLIPWNEVVSRASEQVYQSFRAFTPEWTGGKGDGVINLSRLQPDARLSPTRELRRCLSRALEEQGAGAVEYGPCAGYPPLQEYIAQRLQRHGISASPREILITNGSQHALDLVLRLMTQPGAGVALELPTYSTFIQLLRAYEAEPVGIPMRGDGMALDRLASALERSRPALVYTIPNFHNPTGITSTQKHREQLLHLCEEYRVPLLEDGFEEEMKYWGKVPLPIKSMDRRQVVIYVGTLSKVFFSGLRIGWIAASKECIERLTALMRFSQLSGNMLVQTAINRFCRDGYFDHHLRLLHRVYRSRMLTALEALERFMPESVSWTKPEGGYTIWITMRRPYAAEEIMQKTLLRHRVLAVPGHYFYADSSPRTSFRLSIACLNEQEITEGIRRLGAALDELANNS